MSYREQYGDYDYDEEGNLNHGKARPLELVLDSRIHLRCREDGCSGCALILVDSEWVLGHVAEERFAYRDEAHWYGVEDEVPDRIDLTIARIDTRDHLPHGVGIRASRYEHVFVRLGGRVRRDRTWKRHRATRYRPMLITASHLR